MTDRKWRVSAAAVAILSCSLACQTETAAAQVVATVNGAEVTLQDVDAQSGAVNLPANADAKGARAAVLQQIIARKIMAQEARKQGLDRDPDFVAQQRRAEEELLVATYAKRQMDRVPVPEAAAVTRFMAGNPHMFASRKLYRLNQIQFDMPADPSSLKPLENAHSLDAAAQVLNRMGLKFQRGSGTLDSARIPAQMLEKILPLPKGEPFVVPSPQPGKGLINVITGSEAVPVSPAEQRDMAIKAMRNQALVKIGEQHMADAKARAKIDYRPGYEPR